MSANKRDRSVYFNEAIASNETSYSQAGERLHAPLGKSKSDYLITDMQERSVYFTESSNEKKANKPNPNQVDQKCKTEVQSPRTTSGFKTHNEQKIKRPKTRRHVRAHVSAADEAAVVEKKENEENTPKKNAVSMKMISERANGYQSKPEEKKVPNEKKSNRPTRDNKETKQLGNFDKTSLQEKETPKNKK